MENRMTYDDKTRIVTGGVKTRAYSTKKIISKYPDLFPDGSNGIEWENFGIKPCRKDGMSQDMWIRCDDFDCWIEDWDGRKCGRYKIIENEQDLFEINKETDELRSLLMSLREALSTLSISPLKTIEMIDKIISK